MQHTRGQVLFAQDLLIQALSCYASRCQVMGRTCGPYRLGAASHGWPKAASRIACYGQSGVRRGEGSKNGELARNPYSLAKLEFLQQRIAFDLADLVDLQEV